VEHDPFMTTPTATATTTRPSPTTTTTTTAVDRFLDGIRAGRVPADLYTPDATLDATVPGWRFQVSGADAIAAEYGRWFDHPGTLQTVERHAIPGGEVVRYLQTFEVDGRTHAAHHAHLLTVAGDRIVADTVFCGGRWGPELLDQIGPAAHAG
jgi:ketosteroid isomerase-like protein